ncbi:hypothetical protein LEMLEM_LOCUS23469, partial [Lemmus lemmus]
PASRRSSPPRALSARLRASRRSSLPGALAARRPASRCPSPRLGSGFSTLPACARALEGPHGLRGSGRCWRTQTEVDSALICHGTGQPPLQLSIRLGFLPGLRLGPAAARSSGCCHLPSLWLLHRRARFRREGCEDLGCVPQTGSGHTYICR